MTEDVNTQAPVNPEQKPEAAFSENARQNFARLEKAKEDERERRIKAEMDHALLKQKLEMLEARNQPQERDPLEDVVDYVDPTNYRADQERREKRLKKEAEEIAERKFREFKQLDEQQNHMQRLQQEHNDYKEVMNEGNIVALEQTNPEFVQSLLHIKDDYERKKLAYNFIKRNRAVTPEARPSIKDKIEENARNPYLIPSGSGTPSAVEYDLKSPAARSAAYAKLKAAQRNPLGGGQPR
jgi:hypothetical protein